MKVAAYYRVSTPTQAEANLSIPDQAKQAGAYCASKGWELVREFTEPGDSATDELRPVYLEMMEWVEGKDRPVDVVLVHSFSRFMRDRYYGCATAARMGKSVCPGRSVRMDTLDALVIDAFSRQVLHPGHVGDLLTGLIQDGAARNRERQVKLGDLHRSFKEAQAVVDRLYSAIEKGVFDLDDPDAKERLAQARLRRDEAKRDLDAIRVLSNTTPEITAERIERFTRLLRRHLEEGDVKLRRNWLGLFVDEVLVGDDQIIIRGPTPTLAGGVNGTGDESLPSVPNFVRRWRAIVVETDNWSASLPACRNNGGRASR